MAFDFAGLGGGIGSLVGAAGDVASIFAKPPGQGIDKGLYGFRGIQSTPGYTFGGGTLVRKNDDYRTGLGQLRTNIAGQMANVRPGFGQLTQSGVNAIRQRAAEASGNLRANLARRGLQGASFANDLQTRLDKEYGQMEDEFRAQSFQQEQQATNELMDRDYVALSAMFDQDMKELGLSASFLSGVKQALVTQKTVAQSLAQQNLIKKYSTGGK